MSHSRKYVTQQTLDLYPVPEDEQRIVRVAGTRGGNIVEVEYPNAERVLCLIPTKFQKRIWIKRGNYVIIEPFTEVCKNPKKESGTKLRGRVVHVLQQDQVKYLKKMPCLWPVEFVDEGAEGEDTTFQLPTSPQDSEDEDQDNYLVNPNHRVVEESDTSDDSDTDSSEE